MTVPPPRLHVIPASGCDKALVLRRGPSGEVASLLWDRATDKFQMGQWLRGRIYEHRCDLSPDGRHMVIFARRGDAGLAWTALSRAPWLRALAYWPQDSTWMGGGAFDSKGRLWLNGGWSDGAAALPDGLVRAQQDAYPHATDGFHMGNLFPAMLQARGWTHVSGAGHDSVLTKDLAEGWRLDLRFRLWENNRGIISPAYALENETGGMRVEHPDWEWAEPRGAHLHFAARGALCRARLSPQGHPADVQVIRDFADMSFEAIAAPYTGAAAP